MPPIPTVAVLGLGVGRLLGGAIFAEIIFARPGIGTLVYSAISGRNYPVVQAGVLVVVFLFVLTNLLVDMSYSWLDPRIGHRSARTRPRLMTAVFSRIMRNPTGRIGLVLVALTVLAAILAPLIAPLCAERARRREPLGSPELRPSARHRPPRPRSLQPHPLRRADRARNVGPVHHGRA